MRIFGQTKVWIMNFEIKKHNDFAIIESKVDKLDSLVAPELKAALVALGKTDFNNIIVNLNDTKYCDSSGLSALLVGNRLSKANNGVFVICSLQPSVNKMIEISQLHTILNIEENEPKAVDFVLNSK